MHREPLRNEAYWKEWRDYTLGVIERSTEELIVRPLPEKFKTNIALQSLYNDRFSLIFLSYSGGVLIETIKNEFIELVEAWEQYKLHVVSEKPKKHLSELSGYNEVLWMISFAVLFKTHSNIFEKILLHSNTNGEDALIETLVLPHIYTRQQSTKLLYPKIFGKLYEATKHNGLRQVELVKEYLSNWYGSMRKTGWYDAHKAKGEGSFEGYWSFETAAVVYQYQIDDSSFCNMPFYPKDLVSFARQQNNII